MGAATLSLGADREFALDVLHGLSDKHQKRLSAQFLYDEVGSVLFEAITALPEYGLTRADARLLKQHAPDVIRMANGPVRVVELGSGSGIKTRWVLEAAVQAFGGVTYTPIDVSCAALNLCTAALEGLHGVCVEPQHSTYLDGLQNALGQRNAGETALVLFLGSTIGNFSPDEARRFLAAIRKLLEPGDLLLLGADLLKPVPSLIAAYDDPAGVTAAFNRNILVRINRELQADFDVRTFAHEARFDPDTSRVEMHLRCGARQTVHIRALGRSFPFVLGETIWTESSYKFTLEAVRAMGREAGFFCKTQWVDTEWPFAETLMIA